MTLLRRMFLEFFCSCTVCQVLWSAAFLLLLHTKGDGLGVGSEAKRPISIRLPGLSGRWLANADLKRKKKTFMYKLKKKIIQIIKKSDWLKSVLVEFLYGNKCVWEYVLRAMRGSVSLSHQRSSEWSNAQFRHVKINTCNMRGEIQERRAEEKQDI